MTSNKMSKTTKIIYICLRSFWIPTTKKASDFINKKPSYKYLLTEVEIITGISMVILLIVAFTLATPHFMKNVLKLPGPFIRLPGFNAFWFSHHLTALVYILLLVHGNFSLLVDKWYHKQTCRSEYYSVKLLKVIQIWTQCLDNIMFYQIVRGWTRPYGAPSQDYKNYDILLLFGIEIGATSFISVLRDLINNTRTFEDQTARTHFARPNWKEELTKIALKHHFATVDFKHLDLEELCASSGDESEDNNDQEEEDREDENHEDDLNEIHDD
ncbi:hypothetical protein OROMI_017379 [Orobanche minor]